MKKIIKLEYWETVNKLLIEWLKEKGIVDSEGTVVKFVSLIIEVIEE